jgi:GAF domain-containing protein
MDSEKLAAAFVELADTLVDDFDALDVLHALTARSVELLGATAAGILLRDDGEELQLVASSSEEAQALEGFQLQENEGPCWDCFHTGEPVLVPRLADEHERWPSFVPAAVAAGFTSVIALPMRLRGQIIGGLNLFGTGDDPPIRAQDLPIAQSLADAATIAILQDRLARGRDILNQQLQTALTSRVIVEQAKGALSRHLNVTTDEAFEVLRSRSRNTRRRLSDLAEEVARGELSEFATVAPGE